MVQHDLLTKEYIELYFRDAYIVSVTSPNVGIRYFAGWNMDTGRPKFVKHRSCAKRLWTIKRAGQVVTWLPTMREVGGWFKSSDKIEIIKIRVKTKPTVEEYNKITGMTCT